VQVSFIIPVFNQLAHTRACLEALRSHVSAKLDHEVILVNDGSDDATRSYLDHLSTGETVIHLETNRGYAAATNAGAARATGRWLCLLNNDIELTPGALQAMLEVPEQQRDAGIVGNIQVVAAISGVDHAGIDFVDGGYPLHRRGDLAELQKAGRIQAVPAVTAACCLVDRRWFVAVGGLDERYRNGFEDVDLCLRARENGWGIYLAAHSVVRHAVSASEGRSRYEYRNAQKFLERWGPRTAALEQATLRTAARQYREQQAGRTVGPAPVQAARQAVLAAAARRQRQQAAPVVVWIDLLRMQPGGANGGIKPFVFSFLREMARLTWPELRFVVLTSATTGPEIDFLRPADKLVTQSGQTWSTPLSALERDLPPEVLYCPFATSSFARPGLPSVALMVDILHRDLPSALPIEEVNYREEWFKRVLGSATWLQCNSDHVIRQLGRHYGVHPARCFHTYIAVHGRLASGESLPGEIPHGPFLFYPANFWPHKNHEVLLTAYQLYRDTVGATAWPLILTGHPDGRMQTLQELSIALGLAESVRFLGHVPDATFAALWQHAGALVFPSLHEGFGIPLVEAFHHGVPVAAARATALPEVAGDACCWFDPRDPRNLAETLVRITNNPALRDDLVAAGTARLARFNLHCEASRLAHFLHAAARGLVP